MFWRHYSVNHINLLNSQDPIIFTGDYRGKLPHDTNNKIDLERCIVKKSRYECHIFSGTQCKLEERLEIATLPIWKQNCKSVCLDTFSFIYFWKLIFSNFPITTSLTPKYMSQNREFLQLQKNFLVFHQSSNKTEQNWCHQWSTRTDPHCFLLFFVFARFEKWRTDGRTTCAKTMIPTRRDLGLA